MLTLEKLAELGTRVRLLHPGEAITLDVGFKNLDPEWTWILESHGEVVGVLLACPCHGTVQLVRLAILPGHERLALRLLRACVNDCYRRGYTGFIVWLDPEEKVCGKLMRLLKRAKPVVTEGRHQCIGISAEELRKW